MDVSASTILKSTNFFCKPLRSAPDFAHSKRNAARKAPGCSAGTLKIQSWRCSSADARRIGATRVSAQFRPPVRRRNTLRQKLVLKQEDQVRTVTETLSSDVCLDVPNGIDSEVEKVDASLDFDNNIEVTDDVKSKRSILSGESSPLWDKLENWVDQYKADSEFWGVGTNQIFTIYQDCEGKIVKVSVNEDEIVKRDRARAWSLEEKEGLDEFANVTSKISRAKLIARMIESGEYALPKNSSVVKFIAEGEKHSIFEGFSMASLRSVPFLKTFPRTGFRLLCGCFVIWAVAKWLLQNEKVELSREEAEMLRRKVKLRMEREELEKSRVEVLFSESEVDLQKTKRPQLDRNELMKSITQAKMDLQKTKRPQLDRNELMKSITQAKTSNGNVPIIVQENNFDEKVREIREMARQARELEKEDSSGDDSKAVDITSISLSSEGQTHENATDSTSKFSEEVPDISSEINMLIKQENNMNSHVHKDDIGTHAKVVTENFDNDPQEESLRIFGSSGVNQKAEIGRFRMDNNWLGEGLSIGVDAAESTKLDGNDLTHATEAEDNSLIFQNTACDSNPNGSRTITNSFRSTPRIITSVGEAKEYLAQKHIILSEEIKDDEKGNLKDISGNSDTWNCRNDHNAADSINLRSENADVAKPLEKMQDFSVNATGINCVTSAPKALLFEDDSSIGLKEAYVTEDPLLKSPENFEVSSMESSTIENEMQSFEDKGLQEGNKYNISEDKSSYAEDSGSEISKLSSSPFESTFTSKHDISDCPQQPFLSKGNLVADLDSRKSITISLDSSHEEHTIKRLFNSEIRSSGDSDVPGPPVQQEQQKSERSWVETNFQELDPVIKKIGAGFKENYIAAKEKIQEHSILDADISELGLTREDDTLEWMNDDDLRKIVFQVRDNELAGRDPFYSMSTADKSAFYKGLENIAEKENGKLSRLHEWIHSKIENLDYGADGISLYDPVEKVVPRWKNPSIERDPEFLRHQRPIFSGKDTKCSLQNMEEPSNSDGSSSSLGNPIKNIPVDGSSAGPTTLIECSDGTARPGKKKGMEHWQHTKKWSQGFLEVYNGETDPEVKSVLKNMGKDLNRWMTEDDKRNVADLLTKIPKRKRRYIEKKMEKIKKEVERYGAPAVVSKYREYAEEKEEDYLWWLDLPYVLCVELYTIEEGTPNIGLYSLEMAADLELDPKQYHVIAFEDPGDSKNFCYIVQAHMDMIGSGKAFVVARPPKDTFREAKVNGFSVTVIRKGEIKLNVDKTLEEVEEEITEVGSKIYHDKIMSERSVNIHTLMKGVITADKSTKRRSKNITARPAKTQRSTGQIQRL